MRATIELDPIGRGGFREKLETHQVEVRPEGIRLQFARGQEERTRRPIRYTVLLTPAVHTGSWSREDDHGTVEHLHRRVGVLEGTGFEGIWVEGGERRIFRVTIVDEPVPAV